MRRSDRHERSDGSEDRLAQREQSQGRTPMGMHQFLKQAWLDRAPWASGQSYGRYVRDHYRLFSSPIILLVGSFCSHEGSRHRFHDICKPCPRSPSSQRKHETSTCGHDTNDPLRNSEWGSTTCSCCYLGRDGGSAFTRRSSRYEGTACHRCGLRCRGGRIAC